MFGSSEDKWEVGRSVTVTVTTCNTKVRRMGTVEAVGWDIEGRDIAFIRLINGKIVERYNDDTDSIDSDSGRGRCRPCGDDRDIMEQVYELARRIKEEDCGTDGSE